MKISLASAECALSWHYICKEKLTEPKKQKPCSKQTSMLETYFVRVYD